MNHMSKKLSRLGVLAWATPIRPVYTSVLLASLLCANAPWATATPLPPGTKLTIAPSTDILAVGGLVRCETGSCFGMFLAPGLDYWTPLNPGTDGGLILGKPQKSGGQETNGLLSTGGEITAVWNYGANWGTFFTTPSDAGNVFNDANCTGSGCGSNTTPRLTDLAIWHTAWGGQTIPMGSAAGCNKTLLPACTADQVAGIFVKTWTIDAAVTVPRTYFLEHSQVAPAGFPNFPYKLILRGNVLTCDPCAELAADQGSVRPNTLVTLTGTCRTSVTNITACPILQQTGGPIMVTLLPIPQDPSGIETPTATNTVTFTPTVEGDYTFEVTATRSGTYTASNNTGGATVTVSSVVAQASQPSTNEGCSMIQGTTVNPSERFDWWLVLGFIAWMGLLIRRRQQVRA